MTSLMTTFSGLEINPLNLEGKDICIGDIAHALSCCNRFAGHARWPISVAQHSVAVSVLCEGTPYALQGLLHDASEAYIGDVTKWFKQTEEMRGYRGVEARAQAVIYDTFGCPRCQADIVAWADKLMVRYEYELAFGRGLTSFPGYQVLSKGERKRISTISPILWRPCMTWQEAEANFLVRFYELGR